MQHLFYLLTKQIQSHLLQGQYQPFPHKGSVELEVLACLQELYLISDVVVSCWGSLEFLYFVITRTDSFKAAAATVLALLAA